LDDKTLFPLFGRTVPSDDENTVPIVRFLREVFNIKHLAVIHVNDSFGNNFAEGLRRAAEIHAPDMTFHHIPLHEGEGAVKAAINSLRKTGYRFIFSILFSQEAHDALLTEAYKQGIAGTGVHNWIFPPSFVGTLTDRLFKKGSILHKVYTGTGMVEMSGGLPGISSYDTYQSQMKNLLNPTDLQYFASIWPRHDHANWGTESPFINSDAFLVDLAEASSSYYYEAAISLGLAACEAYKDNKSFSGQDHYDRLKNLTFTGISGKVSFDPISGTRTPGSVMYQVSNFIEREVDQYNIEFLPVVSSIYRNDSWEEGVPFVFNDGTTRLPLDVATPKSESRGVYFSAVVGISLSAVMILCFMAWMYRLKKKRPHDWVWEVHEDDLKFSDPPKVIGQGKAGLVLLADYRGTVVAVKRVHAPAAPEETKTHKDGRNEIELSNHTPTLTASDRRSTKRLDSSERSSWGMASGDRDIALGTESLGSFDLGQQNTKSKSSIMAKLRLTKDKKKKEKKTANLKKLKRAFIGEMQHLSKLRHPCITTIMGKWICENNDRCSSWSKH